MLGEIISSTKDPPSNDTDVRYGSVRSMLAMYSYRSVVAALSRSFIATVTGTVAGECAGRIHSTFSDEPCVREIPEIVPTLHDITLKSVEKSP